MRTNRIIFQSKFVCLLVLGLISFSAILFSDTIIPAGNVSGNWDIDGSPYLIEGEITIPDGETLIIDPGILVEFQGHYKFNIQGRLLAIGTEQDSIYFTINDTTGFSNYSIPDGSWHGIRFDNTPTTNDSSKIIYCKLEYGKAVVGLAPNYLGGAIYCGSIYSGFSKIKIVNSKIINNYATCGGGIALEFCTAILKNNFIAHNISGNKGGGIYCRNSYLNSGSVIESNTISHNFATQEGGGIYGQRLKVSNSLIHSNSAEYGGGLFCRGDNVIVNCTITNNSAQFKGGGLYCTQSELTNVIDCIFWDDNAVEGGDEVALYAYWYYDWISMINAWSPANASFYYDDIESGIGSFYLNYEGSTPQYPIIYYIPYYYNLDSDPLFINPENGNFRFFSDSPCINTGTPDTIGLNLPEYDLDGNPRIYDGRIDMGCYEWQGTETNNIQYSIYNIQLRNYPNPFNPSTTISFSMQNNRNVKISIYNIKGQKVKQLVRNQLSSGQHSVVWNGRDENNQPVSSGIYFYQLKIDGNSREINKMILIK